MVTKVVEVDGCRWLVLELYALDTDLQIFKFFSILCVGHILYAIYAIFLLGLIFLCQNNLLETQMLLIQLETIRDLIVCNSSDFDGSEDF